MKKVFFLFLFFAIFFLFFTGNILASENILTSVRVNPASFKSLNIGDEINVSAIGINQHGVPIYSGVTYEWGISSSGSVAQIMSDQDGKIALLKIIGEGQGDLFVIARNGTQQVTKSLMISTKTNATVCKADIDQSGTVNLADYTVLSANFMKRPPMDLRADINSSGLVDLSDYTLLVNSFFEKCEW
jgi:hypothetical protein